MALPVRPHRQPVIVMYHGVPSTSGATISAAVFEQHVRFLKRHFEFAAPDDVPARAGSARPRVLLTFDDGFRNNAEVVAPILRRHDVPAIFFVCSRHATPGRYLWFSHLDALERHFCWNDFSFRRRVYDMRPSARRRSMWQLRQMLLSLEPHPCRMYQALEEELPPLDEFVGAAERADCYAGMTAEQLGELAADSRFTIGVHTADHPFLSRCGTAEARRQLDANRKWIEDATGRSFRKCYQLSTHAGRVKHIAPADYREGSHLWLLLAEMTREIADRILRVRIEERENATVAAPGF